MESHPDYAICGTNAYHINVKGKINGLSILPKSNEEIQVYKNFGCPFYHPSVLMCANVIRSNNYKKEFEFAEDYELWLRILSNHKGANLGERLLCYRIVKNSISNGSTSKKKQRELTEKLVNPDEVLLNKLRENKFLCSYIQRMSGKRLVSNALSYYFKRILLLLSTIKNRKAAYLK